MKKIRKFAALAMLLTLVLSHEPSFAIEAPDLPPDEQNGFFAKNEECPWHFGLKGWGAATGQTIEKRWAIGGEGAGGPFIEWHPVNGIGIQTGLLYSYHYLYTLQAKVGKEQVLGTGLWSIKDNTGDKLKNLKWDRDALTSDVHKVTFHAISLPLSLRLYPEKTHQLVLYGGPRLGVALGAEECKIWNMNTYKLLCTLKQRGVLDTNLLSDLFAYTPDGPREQVQDLRVIWSWDFGFEFNGKNGFILGINGLGLVLGYDCSRLFI